MAKDIVCIFATSNKSSNSRKVARMLGVDGRNIKRTVENRSSLIDNGNVFWFNKKAEKKSDSLCDATIQ
jgi:phage regulator Rha-like protein